MTERDFQVVELEALETCLEDDGFTPEEIKEILQRVKAGEEIEEIIPDFRNW